MQRVNCGQDGNTPLHHLVKNAANSHNLVNELKKLNHDELRLMARKYNKEGCLPIHLLPQFDSSDEKGNEAFDLLFSAMTETIPLLNEPIDWETIEKKYQPAPGSKLYENLKTGWEVANQIRSFIHRSSTHPQISGWPIPNMNHNYLRIVVNRAETKRRKFGFLYKHDLVFENKDDTLRCYLSDEFYFQLLKIETSLTMRNEEGDCGDIAEVVKYFLYFKKQNCEIVEIKNGDHTFDVIGMKENSNKKNWLDWGEDAVVIDAWAGSVYPASDLPNQLKNYESFRRNGIYYSAVPPFDPDYHQLGMNKWHKKKLKTSANISPDNFPKQFVGGFSKDMSEKELYIFNEYIISQLKKSLKRNCITESDLTELHYPKETLLHAYLNIDTHYALYRGKTTLKEIEDNFIQPKMAGHHATLFANKNSQEQNSGVTHNPTAAPNHFQ